MANYDSGHHFMTLLVPLRDGTLEVDGRCLSHRQRVAELLALLPNGEWLRATPGHRAGDRTRVFSPCSRSPFTRNPRTHFTRLVVIDELPYNGREPRDTLVGALRKRDPLVGQPVDRLSCAWLLWTADFDAASDDDGELDSWLAQTWQAMEAELTPILQHAVGFETVIDADSFIAYARRCQVETTLPFNDYWAKPPALSDVNLVGPKWLGLAGLLAIALGLVVPVLAMLLDALGMAPALASGIAGRCVLLGLALLLLAAGWAWLVVTRAASRPFPPPQPPAPSSTLPSVLKALHLQRAFAAFAEEVQYADAADDLHQRFAAFLERCRPDDLAGATQPPGDLGV